MPEGDRQEDAAIIVPAAARPAAGRPEIPGDTLRRARYFAWLDAHAAVPLRVVFAPPGSGKTTATAAWARERGPHVAWLSLPAGCGAVTLRARLEALLDEAGPVEPLTVVVDDLEHADPTARELLGRLYAWAPDSVAFMYLGRSPATLDVRAGESRGVVAVADEALLRFDGQEIGLFCDALGVRATPHDCARTGLASGGWAVAATGAVRACRIAGEPLTGACGRWLQDNKSLVAALVARALRCADAADAAVFRALLVGEEEPRPRELARLARAGLFVGDAGGRAALNPVVAQALGRPALAPPAQDEIEPALLEMFGRFRMVCGGREVAFARRRDAQIVQFLALRPSGRASRAELLETFWPDGDRQLAAQGLRTAVSAIRRAIAACAGRDLVERYLGCEGSSVVLHFEAVVSTAHRFHVHANLAEAAAARADAGLAAAHWAAARRLYVAPLLAGEPNAGWIEPYACEYARLADLADLAAAGADAEAARAAAGGSP